MRSSFRAGLAGTVVAGLCVTAGTAGATPPGPGVTGTIIAQKRKGTLSHFDSTCQSDGVYKQGSPIIEPSGSNHVHIGRNLGDTPVVLDVLYVLPHGSALSEDAPNPGCDFQ
jgi:hypothetical protein